LVKSTIDPYKFRIFCKNAGCNGLPLAIQAAGKTGGFRIMAF
jgi:hypothetical protein